MKKTIPTTISGILFYIEEDAYTKLSEYLNSIKSFFNGNPDKDEIISDIEGRISEQFLENNKDKIVNLQHIESLIATMGNVTDFEKNLNNDFDREFDSEVPKEEAAVNKKLFRDPDDVIVAGVASGIGAYLGIDPIIIRLIFVLIVFAGGSGFLIYIILWVIIPVAKTSTDKLQMRGQKITLEAVNNVVKEKVDEVKKNKSGLRKIISLPFLIIGTILKAVLPIFRKLIGILITIAASIAIFALTFVLAITVFNIQSPYIDFPLLEIGHRTMIYVGLFSGFFALLIPIIFILFLGQKIIGVKKVVAGSAVMVLVFLWVTASITTGVIATKLVPEYQNYIETSPEYAIVEKDLDLSNFSEINVQNNFKVTVTESPTYKVTVKAPSRNIADLNLTVSDKALNISRNNNFKICIFCDWSRPEVIVEMPNLEKLRGLNNSILTVSATTTDLAIVLSNSSRMNLYGNIRNLNLEMENASWANLSGSGENSVFNISNASRLHADKFISSNVTVKTENASRADVRATKNLDMNSFNGSYILYYGNPTVTQKSQNSSRIRNAEATTTSENPDWEFYID